MDEGKKRRRKRRWVREMMVLVWGWMMMPWRCRFSTAVWWTSTSDGLSPPLLYLSKCASLTLREEAEVSSSLWTSFDRVEDVSKRKVTILPLYFVKRQSWDFSVVLTHHEGTILHRQVWHENQGWTMQQQYENGDDEVQRLQVLSQTCHADMHFPFEAFLKALQNAQHIHAGFAFFELFQWRTHDSNEFRRRICRDQEDAYVVSMDNDDDEAYVLCMKDGNLERIVSENAVWEVEECLWHTRYQLDGYQALSNQLMDTLYGPEQQLPSAAFRHHCPRMHWKNRTPPRGSSEWFINHPQLQRLKRKQSCQCTKPRRACLFMHGSGQKEDREWTNTFPEYWGSIENRLHCCLMTKFLHLDTSSRGWNDPITSSLVCSAALRLSRMIDNQGSPMVDLSITNHSVIQNVTIIAHSSGGLMAANAITTQCSMDENTSNIIALQVPWEGSASADSLYGLCQLQKMSNPSFFDRLMYRLALWKGICPIDASNMHLFSANGAIASAIGLKKDYDRIKPVVRKYVSASMCGITLRGIGVLPSLQLRLTALAVPPFGDVHDGMVDLDSCRGGLPLALFDTQFLSPFYLARINHADGKLNMGDSRWSRAQKPNHWLECQF